MKHIPISCPRIPGLFFAVDDADEAACLAHHWNMGNRYPHFATGPCSKRTQNYAHAFILPPSGGMTVDHVDGDIFNNQRSNLEIVTSYENKRRNSKRSVIRGVRFSPTLGLWCVFCRQNGNHKLTSVHQSMEEAMHAKLYA